MAIHPSSRRAGRRANFWIGTLFAIGSVCFLAGPLPGFTHLIGAEADAAVFFAGSIFFTAAAALQFRTSPRPDRPATLVQLVGTVFFNVNTFRALDEAVGDDRVDRVIWAPEAVGSVCFLISGVLAVLELRKQAHADRAEWQVALVNLAGCVLFGISAVASFVVPSTGSVLDLAAANVTTSLGALCFLIGALMLLPDRTSPGAQ